MNTGEAVRDKRAEISSFASSINFGYSHKEFVDKKRYALSVAKTAHAQMLAENKGKIFAIAQDFDWRIKSEKVPLERIFVLGLGST